MTKNKLRFYPGTHTYWVGKKKLTGVTTYIKQLFEPFNAKEIARKLSKFPANKASGKGVRYFLNEWKQSREFGSKVHAEVEKILVTKVPLKDCEPHTRNAVRWFRDNFHDFHDILVEEQIFDEELELAGTIDLLIKHPYDDKKVILVDWKTNKKISREGFKGKVGIVPPTSNVQDCNLTHYALQLSLYAYMLERKGYEIEKLYIVHLSKEGAEEIQLAYLKSKVEEILRYTGNLNYDIVDVLGAV